MMENEKVHYISLSVYFIRTIARSLWIGSSQEIEPKASLRMEVLLVHVTLIKQSMYTILVQGEEDVNSNMRYPLTNFGKQKDTPKTSDEGKTW